MHNHMDESQRYNAERKKPDTEEYIQYYFIVIKFKNKSLKFQNIF